MKNDTMFGTLVNYQDQDYYEDHPVIYLLTPEKDYKIELFSGFVTDSYSDVYTFMATENEISSIVADGLQQSDFEASVMPAADDRILTLSTCSYEYTDARYVVLGIMEELSRFTENRE